MLEQVELQDIFHSSGSSKCPKCNDTGVLWQDPRSKAKGLYRILICECAAGQELERATMEQHMKERGRDETDATTA